MSKNKIAVILGIVCIILTFSICMQLKTIKKIGSPSEVSFQENELRDEVLILKEKYDNLYNELEKAEEKLEKVREQATQNTSDSSQIEEEIKLNNTLLGLTDVTGEGVIITLKDNPNVTLDSLRDSLSSSVNTYIVHDEDLRMIVNELKNSGAEAISINGERILFNTPITCIGTVIQVNNKRLNSPYIIKAIGNQDTLNAVDRLGSYIDYYIKPYVGFSMNKSNNIEIPKYTGVYNPKYIQPVTD